MDISLLLLILFLGFRNALRAKERGLNLWVWGLLTLILFFAGLFIGLLLSFIAVFKDTIDPVRLEHDKVKYSQEMAMIFRDAMIENPIHSLVILLCGFGGYLIVRYLLSKRPIVEQVGMGEEE